MRQIVSLIKDNQAHFALVDDDSGDMIPFADLLIPDPDRFGLHESAILGTNLISVLGLNGSKRGKVHIPRVGDVLPGQGPDMAEPEALPAAPPKNETAKQRRNRLAREHYARQRDQAKAKSGARNQRGPSQRYVSIDELLAVVAQYPEGIRLTDAVQRLWRQTDGKGTDSDYPNWFYTACSNRLTKARQDLHDKGIPLPFREEDREVPDKHGKLNGHTGKYLLPLSPAANTPAANTPAADTLWPPSPAGFPPTQP